MQKYLGLCWLLGFLAPTLAQADFTLYPYIQNPSENSVVIAFELAQAENATIAYGKMPVYEHEISAPARIRHEIKISGLEPSSLYYYQVKTANSSTPSGSTDHFFRTAARKGESFTMAVYGDTLNGISSYDRDHRLVVESIRRFTQPQFAMILGDLVSDGESPALWQNFFGIERELAKNTALFAIAGDNDHGPAGIPSYFSLPNNERWYSFDWGGCHFIALDIWNSQGKQDIAEYSPQSEQYRWLETTLKGWQNDASTFIVVFVHDPIYLYYGGGSAILQEIYAPLFVKYGVDLVFHSRHLFEYSEHDGVKYVISGGGGAEIMKSPYLSGDPAISSAFTFHHTRIMVDFPVMQVEAIDTAGNILASFTVEAKQKAPTPAQTTELWEKKEYPANSPNANSQEMVLFSDPACSFCQALMSEKLPELARQYDINITLHTCRMDQSGALKPFERLEEFLGLVNQPIPALFLGDRGLFGAEEIERHIDRELARLKSDPTLKSPWISLLQLDQDKSAPTRPTRSPGMLALWIFGLILAVGGSYWAQRSWARRKSRLRGN